MDASWRTRARALTVGLTALPALLYLLLTLRDLSEGGTVGAAFITLAFGGMFFGLAVGVWRGGLFSHYFMVVVGVLGLFNHGPWWFRAAAFAYCTSLLLCLFVSWPRRDEAAV